MNTPHAIHDDRFEPLLIRSDRPSANLRDVLAMLISVGIMLAAIATGFMPVAP